MLGSQPQCNVQCNFVLPSKIRPPSLTPLKIFPAGDKPLTPRTLCEGVAKVLSKDFKENIWNLNILLQVKFIPGEHCFLENIQIQLREIKVKTSMPGTIKHKSFSRERRS